MKEKFDQILSEQCYQDEHRFATLASTYAELLQSWSQKTSLQWGEMIPPGQQRLTITPWEETRDSDARIEMRLVDENGSGTWITYMQGIWLYGKMEKGELGEYIGGETFNELTPLAPLKMFELDAAGYHTFLQDDKLSLIFDINDREIQSVGISNRTDKEDYRFYGSLQQSEQ